MSKIYNDKQGMPIISPKTPELTTDVMFLMGAIKAAKSSKPTVRSQIMTDVLSVLGCGEADLDFLFAPENDNADHSIYDLPDSERRRMVMEANFLDAAE